MRPWTREAVDGDVVVEVDGFAWLRATRLCDIPSLDAFGCFTPAELAALRRRLGAQAQPVDLLLQVCARGQRWLCSAIGSAPCALSARLAGELREKLEQMSGCEASTGSDGEDGEPAGAAAAATGA